MFNEYPYRNIEDLNLDFMQARVRNLEKIVSQFVALESVTFADPIQWNITKQYAKNVVVLDSSGNAFISVKAVPVGVYLNNTDYWLEIFNFIDYVKSFNSNLTFNIENNTDRASASYSVGDWLLLDDILYKVLVAIPADDLFVIGTNIEHFTVEDFIKAWINYANGLIVQYKNDIDASELLYRNQLALDIANTTASLQAQLDAAIAGATVDSEVINARVGAFGTTYATLGDAIRTQIKNASVNQTFIDNGNRFESALSFISGNFKNGDIDGGLVGNAQYRVINADLSSVSEDTEFYIKSGFRIYISYYVAGVYDSNSGWKQNTYTIPAGSSFRIMIARVTENVSEIASVDEFTAALYRVHSIIMKEKYTVRNLNGKMMLPGQYMRGALANDGSFTPYSYIAYRVISAAMNMFNVDVAIKIASGFRVYLSYYDANLDHTGGSGWKTGSFTIPANQRFYIMIARVTDSGSEIADINEFVSAVTTEVFNVPDYWLADLESQEYAINNLNCSVGANGTTFVFFTDYHQNTNNGNSIALIKHIVDHTSANMVIYGGDTSDGDALLTRQASIDMLREFGNEVKDISPVWIRGNHDVEPTAGDTTTSIPTPAFYDIALRPLQNRAEINGHIYYHIDDDNIKFRYIFLDTDNGDYNNQDVIDYFDEQMAWLKNKILELDSNWTVVIFQHIFFTARLATVPTLPRSDFATATINALSDIYDSMQCSIAAIISGHVHRDYTYITNHDVPCIATTCDSGGLNASAYDPDYGTRTAGTTSEQAFDVFTIDTANRTVNATRIGAGIDRSWTY